MELIAQGFRLDIDHNESVQLSYSIEDFTDIGSRKTDFSRTFTLHGTPRNNQFFGMVFIPEKVIAKELNLIITDSLILQYFNPQKTIPCVLLKGNVQVFSGNLKLMKVHSTNGHITYDVMVLGSVGGFFYDLEKGGLQLQDLDLTTSLNTGYTDSNIDQINNDYVGGLFTPSDIFTYPYINYGNNVLPVYPVYNMRPAFFVKNLLDKIFATTKYTPIYSPFFNSNFFNRLVIPNNQEKLSIKGINGMKCTSSTVTNVNGGGSFGGNNELVEFNSLILPLFSTTDNKNFTYTGTGAIATDIKAVVDFSLNAYNSALTGNLGCEIAIFVNGAVVFISGVPQAAVDFPTDITTSITLELKNFILNPSDILSVNISAKGILLPPLGANVAIGANCTLEVKSIEIVDLPITLGDDLVLNDVIPQGVYCKDFLLSILKMFNVYITQDKYNNNIYLNTFEEFYNFANYEDWSKKVNFENFELTPTANFLASRFLFKYKADGDHFNDKYQKQYNIGYGDLDWNLVNNGGSENSVEVIFSATPTYADNTDPFPCATITKLEIDTGVHTGIASNIRILQLNVMDADMDINDNRTNDTTTGANLFKSKVTASMWDNPLVPLNGIYFESLGFGSPKELYYAISTSTFNIGLYSSFWSKYVSELTDASSLVFTCQVLLNSVDIHNLDFGKMKIINGVLYRLLSIDDFDLNNKELATCTFLRVIDF